MARCGCGKVSSGMIPGMGQVNMGVNVVNRCVFACVCVCVCVCKVPIVEVYNRSNTKYVNKPTEEKEMSHG